jgi:hypothetical protein
MPLVPVDGTAVTIFREADAFVEEAETKSGGQEG